MEDFSHKCLSDNARACCVHDAFLGTVSPKSSRRISRGSWWFSRDYVSHLFFARFLGVHTLFHDRFYAVLDVSDKAPDEVLLVGFTAVFLDGSSGCKGSFRLHPQGLLTGSHGCWDYFTMFLVKCGLLFTRFPMDATTFLMELHKAHGLLLGLLLVFTRSLMKISPGCWLVSQD